MPRVTNEISQDYWDKLNEGYDKWFKAPFSSYIRHRQFTRFIEFTQDCDCYLEVGCGTGKFLSRVNCNKKTGVDISEEMVNVCKSKCIEADYHVAPSEKLPFADDSFDCTAMMNVIQYIESPEKALHELYRVTRSGGKILFTVFSKASISMNPLRFWIRRKRGENLPFVNFYTPNEIRRMLPEADMHIVGSGIRPPFESKLLHQLLAKKFDKIESTRDIHPFWGVEMFVYITVPDKK